MRRGISTIVTALIALVAILGTAVVFLQSNSNILSGLDSTQKEKQEALQPIQNQDAAAEASIIPKVEQPSGQSAPPETLTMMDECERYDISQSICSESTLLQRKRFEMPQQEQSEFIKISNAHIWVAANGTSSVAAFVLHNTGNDGLTLQSISIRGQEIPATAWYFNMAEATKTNIQRELTFDGTLAAIEVTGGGASEIFSQANGPVFIPQKMPIIIYLANPGGIQGMDSGLVFSMEIHTDKGSKVVSISAING